MAITAAMVKDLREKTGAGMMDCKKALTAVDGDVAKAIDYLREKGIAKAEKKAGRVAAEGAVTAYVSEDAKVGALVEINCETDFAAGNDQFRTLTAKVAKHIADVKPADLDALNNSEIDGKKVSDLITEATATIGEKISLRRFVCYQTEGRLASYIHMGGKIAALAVLSKDLGEANRGIAMTIASAAPEYLTLADVPAADRERELAIAQKEVAEDPKLASKPENVKAMIAQRKVDSRLGENCLEAKPYALDPDGKLLVSQFLKEKGAKVVTFVRYLVGEGVDKSAKED